MTSTHNLCTRWFLKSWVTCSCQGFFMPGIDSGAAVGRFPVPMFDPSGIIWLWEQDYNISFQVSPSQKLAFFKQKSKNVLMWWHFSQNKDTKIVLSLFQCSPLTVFLPFITSDFNIQPLIAKERVSNHSTMTLFALLRCWTLQMNISCSAVSVWEVKGEGWRWRDSLAAEGWGERGISVKVHLIGHTVTAYVHLVSAWRCCGKPDRGYTRIHNMRSSMTFQCKLTADTIKSIVYRPWCPWCQFWSLTMHLAFSKIAFSNLSSGRGKVQKGLHGIFVLSYICVMMPNKVTL